MDTEILKIENFILTDLQCAVKKMSISVNPFT